VLNAYAIVFAALLVVAGRLADRGGHKAGFQIGLTVFTVGSALCAISPGVGWLVASRVVQAIGAAVLMPTSLALLLATTPPERRSAIVRAWTAIGGVAAALGPVAGGLLVQADWRWVFLINLPVGAVALMAAAATALPPQRFATGSGVVNMARQIGAVLGVAILVSILGTPHGSTQALTAFQHAWVAIGIIGGIAAVASLALPRQAAPAPSPGSAPATRIADPRLGG